MKRARRERLWKPGASTLAVGLSRAAIERMLPHREPFLLIDTITHTDAELKAGRGTRVISKSDPVFEGHFPGQPIYPGVLQLEIMGQVGVCLLYCDLHESYSSLPVQPAVEMRAIRVHQALFMNEVMPGDELEILSMVVSNNGYTAMAAGQLLRSGSIIATSLWEVYIVER